MPKQLKISGFCNELGHFTKDFGNFSRDHILVFPTKYVLHFIFDVFLLTVSHICIHVMYTLFDAVSEKGIECEGFVWAERGGGEVGVVWGLLLGGRSGNRFYLLSNLRRALCEVQEVVYFSEMRLKSICDFSVIR